MIGRVWEPSSLFPDKPRADEMAGGQGNVGLGFWSEALVVPQPSPNLPPPGLLSGQYPHTPTSRVLEGGPPGPKDLSKAV